MSTLPHQQQLLVTQKLSFVNEQAWLTLGNISELMDDYPKAMNSYESALRHNPYSIPALSHIASLYRGRDQFSKAVDYFKRILALQDNNGDIWGALGHCYLMLDNLQEAYQAYQQALYHLKNPKDPKLWYGIGILYDRYGSIEHAEEAFTAIMQMDPKFEKANEIYFRLGIIYKQQQKYDLSLQYFRYILHNPPKPLTETDIWFQIGHVYEQQKEYEPAKEAYEKVLKDHPDHSKVLQQLGWLYHQQNTSFSNHSTAIQYLTRSIKSDNSDAQSWYLIGRCYMAEQNHNKAYEAYQQAIQRDARNPTFWCSIGVLYYQINQYRDSLDAYSRAIRLNPYISEVWYNLGTLYESCNNQTQDALDAYQRASELDPNNSHVKQRIELLRKPNIPPSSTPIPQDVHNPYQYQNNNNNPSPLTQPSSDFSAKQHHRKENSKLSSLPSPSNHMSPNLNQNVDLRFPDLNKIRSHPKMMMHSPIPAKTMSPKLALPPPPATFSSSSSSNNSSSYFHSPRSSSSHQLTPIQEPLRRTSVLYEHSMENNAADTLMSMAQQKSIQKRSLEMADEDHMDCIKKSKC